MSTTLPGATQEVMQGFVTTPIAQSIATASGIEYLSSTTTQGKSEIKARLVLNANADRAMTEILAKVQQVKYQLPTGVTDPVISKSTEGGTAVQYVAFYSDTLSIPQVTDFATRVAQPLFTGIPGVASADIMGGQTLAMRIWIDPVRLAARGLSAGEIAAALRANNVQAAPGQLKSALTVTNISAATDLRGVEDFRQMVIKSSPEGGLVRLSDVATVEIGGQNYNNAAFATGKPAIFIGIQPAPDGNPIDIVKQAKELIPKIREMAPPGLKVSPNYDIATFVNASIEEVKHTLVEAIVIVIVVIFLFLGTFRAVIIPVVTIPLSLVGTAALMLACGFSINLLTLLAMVLAIGLVVDDAIVVVENIHRHIEEGYTPVRAALLGAREIVGPVIAMTITLAAVYAPIGMMGADRRTVQGVRLHAGWLGHRLGRGRTDTLAGHEFDAVEFGAGRGTTGQTRRAHHARADRFLRTPAGTHAGRARRGSAGGCGGIGGHRGAVQWHAPRTGTNGRPGHRTGRHQGAAVCGSGLHHPLCRADREDIRVDP